MIEKQSLLERLVDFERHGLTVTERFTMRMEAWREIKRLRSVLEFYADPFAWKAKHDPENDFQVPNFYSETNFGDTASEALAVSRHSRGGDA